MAVLAPLDTNAQPASNLSPRSRLTAELQAFDGTDAVCLARCLALANPGGLTQDNDAARVICEILKPSQTGCLGVFSERVLDIDRPERSRASYFEAVRRAVEGFLPNLKEDDEELLLRADIHLQRVRGNPRHPAHVALRRAFVSRGFRGLRLKSASAPVIKEFFVENGRAVEIAGARRMPPRRRTCAEAEMAAAEPSRRENDVRAVTHIVTGRSRAESDECMFRMEVDV
jgi:hypothetical protein